MCDLYSEQAADSVAEGIREKSSVPIHALKLGHLDQGSSWNRVERERTPGFTLQVFLTLPGNSSTESRELSGSHCRQNTGGSCRSTQEV